jgi:pimeloyl-ACP methyl ester carboxylesterase
VERLYITNSQEFLVYQSFINDQNSKNPYIIYVHGLKSSMQVTKATALRDYCAHKGYNYLLYDALGCGQSSGEFVNQNTSIWLSNLEHLVDSVVPKDSKIILVGSSNGGWISTLYAQKHHHKMLGLINIAAAIDFTEELIWKNLTLEQQAKIIENNFIEIQADGRPSYNLSYDFILDARKHLLFTQEQINITCPVHILHGTEDKVVPYQLSLRLAEKIRKDNDLVYLFLRRSPHTFSSSLDIDIITDCIEQIRARLA